AKLAAEEIDLELGPFHIDLVIVDIGAAAACHEALEALPARLGLGLVEVPGDLPVPRIAVEGEFEIAPPDVVAHIGAHEMRRHMLVIADARVMVALGPPEQLSPQRTLRLQRMLDAIILRRPALAVLLALLSVRRDHAIGPAQLRQSRLDGRA